MTVIAEIDSGALQHNLAQVKCFAPHSRVLVMIKANAYGHGFLPVAQALTAADALAVARLEEALVLREHFAERRIVIFSECCNTQLLQQCATHSLDLVLHQAADVETLCALKLSAPINIWLKLDTGMHRLGLSCADAENIKHLALTLADNSNTRELTLMSHLASAEADADTTGNQLRLFAALTDTLSCERSLANSAAIMQQAASHFDWVRPGIMLYGASPFVNDASNGELQPVMTLTAPLIAVNLIQSGECVGYNGTWQARRDSLIGTIGIGYGDGYPRHAPNGTPVLVNGQRVPLVGRVSMDMITVDLTDSIDCAVGDRAELWGKRLLANEVANCATTISYDLFTGVSQRVRFCYV